VREVALPVGFPGKVPAGEIIPVGGGYNPQTGDVDYPVGYFVRPIRPGDKESMKRLARISKRVQNMAGGVGEGDEGDPLLDAADSLEQLIEMAFLPYYGTAKLAEIKEQLTFSAMGMLMIVEALKSNEVLEITCLK
jgi:hypothetical protein